MAVDLPPGEWTASLIGAWWPPNPAPLATASQTWTTAATGENEYAQTLHNARQRLMQNQGRTADDLFARYQKGINLHQDRAEKYEVKSRALDAIAGAGEQLRSKLTGIAERGNARIKQIQASKSLTKPVEIAVVQGQANAEAANASRNAVATGLDQIEKMLQSMGMDMSAREFIQSQGLSAEEPPAPRPIDGTPLDVDPPASGSSDAPQSSLVQEAPGSSEKLAGVRPAVSDKLFDGAPPPAADVPAEPSVMPAASLAGGAQSGATVPSASGGVPSVSSPLSGAVSPESLSQSFNSGMAAGQPAAAAGQAMSAGTMDAVGAAQAQHQPAMPSSAPAVTGMSAPTASVGGVDAGHHVAGAEAATPGPVQSAPVGGAGMAMAPMMSGGAAPAAGAPAGPLPAYGSDLRPPVVAPPPAAAAAGPAAPVSGAPTGAPSSPSSGSAVPPVVRPGTTAATTAGAPVAGAGSPTLPAGAVAAATAGAAAGQVSARTAEQQRLQRIVHAVVIALIEYPRSCSAEFLTCEQRSV